jgi:hypothetical protein
MTRDPFEQRTPPRQGALPELAATGYLPPRGDQVKAPSLAAAPPPPPTSAVLMGALDRLDDLIDQENAALAGENRPDFADLNRRKSQSLLELTRLGRALPLGASGAIRDRIANLRDKLADNQRALGLHLSAVREISDLLVGTLSAAQSDGTYGAVHARREPSR